MATPLCNLTRLCYSHEIEKGNYYEYGYHTSSGELG